MSKRTKNSKGKLGATRFNAQYTKEADRAKFNKESKAK